MKSAISGAAVSSTTLKVCRERALSALDEAMTLMTSVVVYVWNSHTPGLAISKIRLLASAIYSRMVIVICYRIVMDNKKDALRFKIFKVTEA